MDTMLRTSGLPQQRRASAGRTKQTFCGLDDLAAGLEALPAFLPGWDNPSTVQGEVKDPSRTYLRALAFALPLVTIDYFVPLLTTLGASDWTTWTEGGWPQIAASATGSAGRWIAIWIALGG